MADQNRSISDQLRNLPSVDLLLKDPDMEKYTSQWGRNIVLNAIRNVLDDIRGLLIAKKMPEMDESQLHQRIINEVKEHVETVMMPYFRRVVNATGIILHTGLGRAVLAQKALQQVNEELSGYSLLQLDVETGKRSGRDGVIEKLFQQITGAKAATVVNNNAAATSIVLNTIAKDKEVIVSRGQLVEIGGSFRLPDVMAFSGAKLVEVGTTNKTHARDYVNAVNENTAAILRVHPSNYKIQGFSSEVSLEELVRIAHEHKLVMIDDVGAGSLIDFSQFGFESEPTLTESIKTGADIVTSSGDKLIGASQAGIILGKAELISAIRKNQFARIVRPGKLTLAVLEATLKLFLDELVALREIPTLQMLRRDLSEITRQAEYIASQLEKSNIDAQVSITDGFSQMGSGSLPTQNLATTHVVVRSEKISAEFLAKRLRQNKTPIFTRIQNDQVLIDPRTLRDGDDKIVIEAVCEILSEKE